MGNAKSWIVTKNTQDQVLYSEANWQDCLAKIVKAFEMKDFGIELTQYKGYQVFHENNIYYIRFNYDQIS